MRIGLDASFAINDESGIGRYSFNLIKNILTIDNKNQYILFCNYFRNRVEKEKLINELVGDSKNVKIIKNHLFGKIKDKIWENPIISPLNLYFSKLDLYHATCFQAYPKKIGNIKSVVTIHDLTYLLDKNYHQNLSNYYKKLTSNAVNKADIIIADSNATKNDIIKYFKTEPDKIKTIYLGVDSKFKPASSKEILKFKNKYTSGSEYILSVGTLEPRKNLPRLIKAYQQLPLTIQNQYKLLVVGKSGWDKEVRVLSKSKESSLNAECRMQNAEFKKNNIVFTGFISDDELITAYSGASLFVYPSLYEGFGFPPLEAMACGVPVVTSDISSLPEVAGCAALYCDSYDSTDIADKITTLITEKQKDRITRIEEGFRQTKKFSWQNTAKETLKIYNKLF